MKWIRRGLLLMLAGYLVLFAAVGLAMLQPPARFGAFMRYMPTTLVWAGLPATRMWMWARKGHLNEGDIAPDFSLRSVNNRSERVTLSSYRGDKPVVLVFGSYT